MAKHRTSKRGRTRQSRWWEEIREGEQSWAEWSPPVKGKKGREIEVSGWKMKRVGMGVGKRMCGIEMLKKNWERDEDRGDKQESGL